MFVSSIEDVFDEYGNTDCYLRDLDDELSGILLHGIPSFPSEHFFFGFLSLLETSSVSADEFQ